MLRSAKLPTISKLMNSDAIPLNKWGKIMRGENTGWYVFVEDDSANTGGFLILRSPEKGGKAGFDDWVLTLEDLRKFFGFANWQVEWLE